MARPKKIAQAKSEGNGRGNGPRKSVIVVPKIIDGEFTVRLQGTTPLIVNNKYGRVEELYRRYGPDKTTGARGKAGKTTERELSEKENYNLCFYLHPSSKYPAGHPKATYGVPASGIRKCFRSAIRQTGITDNITVGNLGRAFDVKEDGGGLCILHHKGFEEDRQGVNIGSGKKSTPTLRVRPVFNEWYIDVTITFNYAITTVEALVQLIFHAGVYIGLCEKRPEKGHSNGKFVPVLIDRKKAG